MNKGGKKQLTGRLFFGGFVVLMVVLITWLAKTGSDGTTGPDVTDVPFEKGKAVLIEYSDYQCPACAYFYPVVQKLKADFGDKLVFEYRHFPLKNIHKNAQIAAEAAEAARMQGKFDDMSRVLFEKQNEWSASSKAGELFLGYATGLGMDGEKFKADLNSDAVTEKVDADYASGVKISVRGTPTFFLNGRRLDSNPGYEQFKELIQKAIEQ